MKLSKKRTKLLLKLESLVGNECYNGSIQNWGAGGVFEGEGRDFRYPITFVDEQGKKFKRRYLDDALPALTTQSGHYAFGANQLHIIGGLNSVISHLEEHYGLEI